MPQYTPGEWVAVVAPGCVLLVPGTAPDRMLQRLWESMSTSDDAALVPHLGVLARDGLDALPPFALLGLADGRLHAALRGTVTVEVATARGVRVLTAPHVSTWSEEVVEGVTSVTVRAPGAAGPADGAGLPLPWGLPLLSGVVRAGAVRVTVPGAVAGTGVAAEVAPAAQPAAAQPAAAPVSAEAPAVAPPEVPLAAGPAPVAALPATTSGLLLAPVLAPAGAPLADVPSARLPVADEPFTDEPFDNTLLRPTGPVVDAAVDHAPGERLTSAPATVSAAASTDHDGTTVLGADVLALRRQLPEWTGHALTGPLVVPAAPTPAPARLALSTGQRVTLTRPVLIGRAPQASRVSSTQVPRLVTVPSPMQDISRTHAEVRMDGDDVVLTDLRSTNGVLVVRPAAAPQRLQPGEATVLQPGVLVDLGEDITFTVERGA